MQKSRYFSFDELQRITKMFAEERKLGSGGYGVVYKGVLDDGEVIAVKKLRSSMQGTNDPTFDNEFDNEFLNLGKVDHPNVVRVIGYCHESRRQFVEHEGRLITACVMERLLCFEYVEGGSLDKHISDELCDLDWPTCYGIIRGTCEGLNHLHAQGEPIYHLDLKPANILLDRNMMPKIANLGLSRIVASTTIHRTHSQFYGTIGYMPPEYVKSGYVSSKFDVFSLGVIIIRIMDGNAGNSRRSGMPRQHFINHVTKNWNERLQGTSRSSQEINILQVKTCVDIALRCVEDDRKTRPRVLDIVQELKALEDVIGELSPEIPKDLTRQIMEPNILERIIAGIEEPSDLDLPLLQRITENFSEKKRIGVGGCGQVYKGIVRNGVVAVKRLFQNRTIKDKMFHREVKSLIMVRHNNIVRFLGYCSFTAERVSSFEGVTVMVDIRERLLCFEYVSNGSLESHITDELRGLEWHTRYEIIVGICKGMLYLHKENNIIHMDLKPANILLDDHMVPKITDFGLSRLDNNSQTTTTTRLISPGYCAPEYLLEGKSSSKSDIYSLGVIIMEVVTGSKKMMPNITKVLRKWRYRWIKSSDLPALGYRQVKKCLDLAHRCTQHDPTCRPDMSNIIHELNEIDSREDQFQVIPSLEDMLGIEPLEIQFPSELYWQVSHTVVLSNDTDDYFAFLTKPSLRRLRTEPDKGIVPPGSMCSITVTMTQVQFMALSNNRNKGEITVLSTRVDGGLAALDITKEMFMEREGKVVDEVNVVVTLGRPPSEEES